MASNVVETIIGAAVLAVAGGFLFYAANTADVTASSGYEVKTEFREVAGLTVGTDVRVAGVKIGTVRGIVLNVERYRPVISMTLRDGVEVPEDSLVEIASEGLLGGNYLNIKPGASDFMVKPGGELESEPYVSLTDLIKIAMKNL